MTIAQKLSLYACLFTENKQSIKKVNEARRDSVQFLNTWKHSVFGQYHSIVLKNREIQ